MSACKCCGEELKRGDFAWEQEVCWDCFEKKFMEIVNKYRCGVTAEQRRLLYHLMAVTAERFGRKFR